MSALNTCLQGFVFFGGGVDMIRLWSITSLGSYLKSPEFWLITSQVLLVGQELVAVSDWSNEVYIKPRRAVRVETPGGSIFLSRKMEVSKLQNTIHTNFVPNLAYVYSSIHLFINGVQNTENEHNRQHIKFCGLPNGSPCTREMTQAHEMTMSEIFEWNISEAKNCSMWHQLTNPTLWQPDIRNYLDALDHFHHQEQSVDIGKAVNLMAVDPMNQPGFMTIGLISSIFRLIIFDLKLR